MNLPELPVSLNNKKMKTIYIITIVMLCVTLALQADTPNKTLSETMGMGIIGAIIILCTVALIKNVVRDEIEKML